MHSFDMCSGVSFCLNVLRFLFPFILPAVSVGLLCLFGGGLASLSGSGSTPWALSEAHPARVRPACPAWDAALPPWGLLGPLGPLEPC